MKLSIFLGALLFLNQTPVKASDSDDTFKLATELSKCVGYYDFMSDFSKSQGEAAAAEHMHNMSNGAKSSAAYILSIQYNADNLDKPAKPFPDFYEFVDGRSETVYTQLMAALEANQTDLAQLLSSNCIDLAETQESILNMIRKQVYLPNSN